MKREQLIDKVLEQIKRDVNNADLTAIAELLERVDEVYLIGFLSED